VPVRKHRRLLDDPIELAYQATSVLPLLLSGLPITDVIGSSFPGGLAEALVDLLSLLYVPEEPVNADALVSGARTSCCARRARSRRSLGSSPTLTSPP
jgi:hypothetical protein